MSQVASQIYPQHPDALHAVGIMSYQVGKHMDAIDYICRAILMKPDNPDFHNNLAAVYLEVEQPAKAIECCERALELNPNLAEVHNHLGNAYRDLGRTAEAEDAYRRATAISPDLAPAWLNLGNVYRDQSGYEEAIRCCQNALRLNPNYPQAHNNLGVALEAQGRTVDAIKQFQLALQAAPEYAEPFNNLGSILRDQGRLQEALVFSTKAVVLQPSCFEAYNNIGRIHQIEGNLVKASTNFERAIEIRPSFTDAHNNLGVTRLSQGRLDDAIACYRQSMAINPEDAEIASNLLVCEQYQPDITLDRLLKLHLEWDRAFGQPLKSHWRPFDVVDAGTRALRLGFVSCDLGCHPVGYFLVKAFEQLDRSLFHTICYSDRRSADAVTKRFVEAAGRWRDTRGLSDEQLAETIRKDQVDILFDLGGHFANNRLLTFARKPAPIQLTWAGYVGTTGLEAIDFVVADRFQVPESVEPQYRERVLRLAASYINYSPPDNAPDVGPLPAFKNGFVTFGSFNNPTKLNAGTIEVWAKILHRVDDSRILLKYGGIDDESNQQRLLDLFLLNGIDASRVDLRGRSPHREFLEAYNEVDIGLDTFPYSGGLTTCESLWMGVPVVTCPGETFASRHSCSHLSNAGLYEMIAEDFDHYVDYAVELAHDLPRLATIRGTLRRRVAMSPLCDTKRFVEGFQDTMRRIWKEWCDQH